MEFVDSHNFLLVVFFCRLAKRLGEQLQGISTCVGASEVRGLPPDNSPQVEMGSFGMTVRAQSSFGCLES